jgi:uncharacterized protein (TIGR02145 family)
MRLLFLPQTTLIIAISIFTILTSFVCNNSYEIEFKHITINGKSWMAENLNIGHFSNGDVIYEVKSNEEWEKAGELKRPAWAYYDNKEANGKKYGKLYNWYAINDSRGLAPEGWHIPSIDEWKDLFDFLGDGAVYQVKKKSAWKKNGKGHNSSGLSVIPGGSRFIDGSFRNFGEITEFWAKTEKDSLNAYNVTIHENIFIVSNFKNNGFYVRCVKN